MPHICEVQRNIPIVGEFDVCVLGGSCTGVFAAVRAARLGMRVALVEKQNAFGGVATSGLVCVWHSFLDTEFKRQIIGGLSHEVVERLRKREAVDQFSSSPDTAYRFNSEELKIELDELVRENGITPFLHTLFCAPHCEDGRIRAVIIENKDGRSAISAKVFIDATGDGDLAAAVGLPFTIDAHLQPPTTCAKISGLGDLDLNRLLREHREEYGIPKDSGWQCDIPGGSGARMYANTHVFGCDASKAGELTAGEMEGRRLIRALMDMARKYEGKKPCLLALPSYIGIRETRRFQTEHVLTEDEVLHGNPFADAIANGSYRVDVHNTSGGGFVFKYLDGSTLNVGSEGCEKGRWRPETPSNPTFYQVPYSCLYMRRSPNLLLAGRMIGTDRGAFGAVRVMVNLNQTGEAAGVAAALAVEGGVNVDMVDPRVLRAKLSAGGSVII